MADQLLNRQGFHVLPHGHSAAYPLKVGIVRFPGGELPGPQNRPKMAFFLRNRTAGIMRFSGDIVAIADGERRGQNRA